MRQAHFKGTGALAAAPHPVAIGKLPFCVAGGNTLFRAGKLTVWRERAL